MRTLSVASILLYALLMLSPLQLNVALSTETQMLIEEANMSGPYLGLVIPNSYEMDPLLQSPNFTSSNLFIDFSGRRFRFGTIANKPVILVMTGLSMINAAITTQLLLSQFDIEGVVHYGVAGHANPSLNLADVVIPQYWSHSALWSWQRYGNGPEDELPLEKDGDYTREIGYLNVANYTTNVTDGSTYDNLLNNIWFQPEEVFPIDGTPEERQHSFWVAVDPLYYEISQKLELSLPFPWLFVARPVPPLLVLPSTAPTAILIIIPETPAINFMAIPLAIPSMANRGDHRAVPLLPVLPAAMHLPVLPGSHGFLLPGPIISPRPITCKAPRPPPPLLLQRPTKCTGPSPLCMTCSLPCLTSLPSSTPVF